jgi:ATP-dependent DNA ligase
MLAEAGKLDMVEAQMNHKEFYIETKYDGERMQAHIEGNKFRYLISRQVSNLGMI